MDIIANIFDIIRGSRQGCILSPYLINLYTEQVMRKSDVGDIGVRFGSRNVAKLRYTDGTAALQADNITNMKRILHRVDSEEMNSVLTYSHRKLKPCTQDRKVLMQN